MAEIIGVRFKNVGKIYYFDPNGMKFEKSSKVIVETARGTECGEVVMPNRQIDDKQVPQPLKKVVRLADDNDIAQMQKNREKEAHAMKVCQEKIRKHKLDMKLIDVEYTFDNNKILFYFTAEGRVDFRELVKDLASVLKSRIELRQIGVRDEAKMLGGLGICGRPFCCSTFLGEFQPVSIKMAKEQGLSLNPTKISGTCGRLMCCLKYEQHAYEDLLRTTPKQGTHVQTPDGRGVITEVNLLSGMLKVVLEKTLNGAGATMYHKDDVTPIRKEDLGKPFKPDRSRQDGDGKAKPPRETREAKDSKEPKDRERRPPQEKSSRRPSRRSRKPKDPRATQPKKASEPPKKAEKQTE